MKNDQERHIELLTAIASLSARMGVVETQVTDISRRVGIQNGRVADSEAAIKKILLSDSYKDGERDGIKIGDKKKEISNGRFLTIIGLIVTVIGILLYNIHYYIK
jgi:hypothetical protein